MVIYNYNIQIRSEEDKTMRKRSKLATYYRIYSGRKNKSVYDKGKARYFYRLETVVKKKSLGN